MISSIQSEQSYHFITNLFMKIRRAAELAIAKNEFVFLGGKKEKSDIKAVKAATIKAAKNNKDENPGRGDEFLKEYVSGLEEMMFMTHHKVRQPVANILGMAGLIDQYSNSPDELKKIAKYMKQSASDLDDFTRELTAFISNLEQKGKKS